MAITVLLTLYEVINMYILVLLCFLSLLSSKVVFDRAPPPRDVCSTSAYVN